MRSSIFIIVFFKNEVKGCDIRFVNRDVAKVCPGTLFFYLRFWLYFLFLTYHHIVAKVRPVIFMF